MTREAKPKPPKTWDSPEYIAWAESKTTRLRISYVDADDAPVDVLLVHRYDRGDSDIRNGPIMSASSGPKDYLKNDIIGLFESRPEINQVAMILLPRNVPAVIIRTGEVWRDLSGRILRVQIIKGES